MGVINQPYNWGVLHYSDVIVISTLHGEMHQLNMGIATEKKCFLGLQLQPGLVLHWFWWWFETMKQYETMLMCHHCGVMISPLTPVCFFPRGV